MAKVQKSLEPVGTIIVDNSDLDQGDRQQPALLVPGVRDA